jgi:hypothetical protein
MGQAILDYGGVLGEGANWSASEASGGSVFGGDGAGVTGCGYALIGDGHGDRLNSGRGGAGVSMCSRGRCWSKDFEGLIFAEGCGG